MVTMLLYLALTILQAIPIHAAPLHPSEIEPFRYANQERTPRRAGFKRHIVPKATTDNPYLAGYAPISESTKSEFPVTNKPIQPYQEGYSPVSVLTSTGSNGVAQILPPYSGPRPDSTGTCHSSLDTSGQATVPPLITTLIQEPTSHTDEPPPGTIITRTSTRTSTMGPVSSTPRPTPSDSPTTGPTANSPNIFANPIDAGGAPSSRFQTRRDHPVPRRGINGPAPISTNKFYANFYLGNQNTPAFLHPYSVAWAKGQGATASWGMCISHIETSQMVFGENSPGTSAARYFINPIGIQSICLSAVELGTSTILTTDNLQAESINVNLHKDQQSAPMITFPLVQGMGFITGVYKSGTPVISTGLLFKTVTKSTKGQKAGVTKYTLYLEDGTVWQVYAYTQAGDPLDLQVINNGLAKSTKPFTGFIQIAKDAGNSAEAALDAAAAAYPVGVDISGAAAGAQGTYTFKFLKAGDQNTKLLMYALPHHVDSFDASTKQGVRSNIRLQTTTKGMATAVVGDSWTMIEPNMPVSMDFAPWDPAAGPKKTLKDSFIKSISPTAAKEIAQNVDDQSNLDSMYFSGKALAKFASLCYTVKDLLNDPDSAAIGLEKLKAAFSRFSQNKQKHPLYYESAWGGVVSSATYTTGNTGVDFGNSLYNDHHFHYGYFVFAAALIGYLDPSWLTKDNVEYVNTLVRDIANPSRADKYFPVSRNFDWYHGHSWAHGLYETSDGKNQESSSEDTMHAYAIKMWGKTSKDTSMEARGNLMLSVLARSLNQYYLYTADNKVQPSKFIGNRVAGILFENKIDHTTYFGTNIEYIQGIHMLPLLSHTKFTRPPKFVREEWATYFDNGRVDTIEGGWRGILYANLATIDPTTAWDFFTRKDFNPSWLDGGASLTWYQAYAAAFLS